MANKKILFYVVVLIVLFGLSDSTAKSVNVLRTNNQLEIEYNSNELNSKIDDDDIYKFVQLYPTVHVEELIRHNVQDRITYVLGARIAGDSLVAHGAKNQTWSTPQDVSITLTYPVSGVGKQVTYVAVQVDQSTNLGKAYVLKGGLHERSITIVVEAYTTYYLNYDVQFYGV